MSTIATIEMASSTSSESPAVTLAYAAYGYVFHLAFDHVRPVPARHPRRSET